MKIALIGFGNVGQGLAAILRDKAQSLVSGYGFSPCLVAVATRSHGTLLHPDGLDIDALLDATGSGSFAAYPQTPGLQRDWDAARIVRESGADVLVEVTPSDVRTGQPALDLCYAAFDAGMHVVLANKGPVAVDYAGLKAKAAAVDRLLRCEATVMAGTPVLRVALQDLAGCRITAVRGILNGTTNYILTQMESGMDYAEALKQAQLLGYAETDPTADVEGWDSAGKTLILAAAIFGVSLTLDAMPVTGISHITRAAVEEAQQNGERWKLIAQVTTEGGRIEPVRLPFNDPLAGVGGASNAVTFTTDLLGNVTIVGPGAGRVQTGFGLLSDLIDISRRNS